MDWGKGFRIASLGLSEIIPNEPWYCSSCNMTAHLSYYPSSFAAFNGFTVP